MRMTLRYLLLSTSLVLASAPALADATTDCIDANEKSIQLRKDNKLIEARVEVAKCTALTCSEDVRQLCADRASKLTDAIPSIVFDIKDGSGRDLAGVNVRVDGAAAQFDPTVTALELDPGSHAFVFETLGQAVERTFVLHPGEKQRHEPIVIGAAPLAPYPAPASLSTPTVQSSSGPPSATILGGRPTWNEGVASGHEEWQRSERAKGFRRGVGIAFSAIGVALAATFGVFLGLGAGENSAISKGGFATGADISNAASTGQTYNTGAIVSGIAGAVSLGVGLSLVLADLPSSEPSQPRGFFVGPTPGGAVAGGRF
jgi:hypothetical protein